MTTLDAQAVTIEDGLWARRQAVNREIALPHGYRMLEAAGNLENLRIAPHQVALTGERHLARWKASTH